MRKAWWVMLALLLAVALVANLQAQDKKDEKTLKGNITCPKCELKIVDKCMTVIVVKEGDKDVIYYFDDAAHGKYHDDICTQGKKGAVTGTVSEKDGKKMVKVSKLSYDK